MRRLVWLGVLSLVACGGGDGDDDDDIVAIDAAGVPDAAALSDAAVAVPACEDPLPGADHRQWVIDSMTMPQSATQAQQLGIDLDGDPQGRPDNALGQILSTLASQGDLSIQENVDQAITDGTVLHLLDLESATPSVRLFLGGDCDAPPNPLDNFDGDELFSILADAPIDPPLPASSVVTDLVAGPGSATVELIVVAGPPIRLPLYGVRIEGTVGVSAITSAKLGGAVLESDLNEIMIPAMAAGMQDTVDAECSGTFPNCCPPGSTGETVLDLFDQDGDCAVTVDELRTNDLISSLLWPDVDLFDGEGNFNPRVDGVRDSLSLGVGFTAVPASFPLPE